MKFEVHLSMEVSDDNVLSTSTQVLVDSKPIGVISRLRIDHDMDEILPSIEIDMLRGLSPFLDGPTKRATRL